MTDQEETLINSGKICSYCNCKTELVSDKAIYGPNTNYGGMFYRCLTDQDHYVGTYADNTTSLGRLANKELRTWKIKGHNHFDPLWKEKKGHFRNRYEGYKWLSTRMRLDMKKTHFGMFTIEQCKRAVELCVNLKRTER
jgi:hypothetical protein